MIVVSLDRIDRLLKADVVEASERRSSYVLYRVIGHKKVLLPAHEGKVRILQFIVVKFIEVEAFRELTKCSKLSPVFFVNILVCIPLPRQERILPADDLTVEKCRQRRELFR